MDRSTIARCTPVVPSSVGSSGRRRFGCMRRRTDGRLLRRQKLRLDARTNMRSVAAGPTRTSVKRTRRLCLKIASGHVRLPGAFHRLSREKCEFHNIDDEPIISPNAARTRPTNNLKCENSLKNHANARAIYGAIRRRATPRWTPARGIQMRDDMHDRAR